MPEFSTIHVLLREAESRVWDDTSSASESSNPIASSQSSDPGSASTSSCISTDGFGGG